MENLLNYLGLLLKNPLTRDPYERGLMTFLKTLNMTPDELVNFAKEDVLAAERK
jgi:hypothetical protein